MEKARFRTDPDFFLKYRTTIERAVVSAFPMFFRGGKLNATAKDHMTKDMRAKLGNDEELICRIVPDFSPGCRRLTPGEDYLETFSKPHVHAVFDGITRFTPEGILTADNTNHQFDIIACATGFDVQYSPRLRITGLDGRILEKNVASMSMRALLFPTSQITSCSMAQEAIGVKAASCRHTKLK